MVEKLFNPKNVWWVTATYTGLAQKQVNAAVAGVFRFASYHVERKGSFKLGSMLKMKLKETPSTPERRGLNPFTKKECVFKAKPAWKTVKLRPLTKLNKLVNR